MKSHKCQFGNMVFTIRDVKGIWKLDFQWDGKRQRPSMEMKATSDNLELIKREILPDLYLQLSGIKADPISVNMQAPKTPIFADVAERSLELLKHDVEGHVLRAKQQILERDILPFFGTRKINSIQPSEVREWQNNLAERVSIGTIKKYRGVLNQILDYAWIEGTISENPVLKTKLPKNAKPSVQNAGDHEIYPFSESEINRILSLANGAFKNFLICSFYSGIRPNELTALTWEDVSFESRKIRISKTIKRSKDGGYTEGKPKTPSSVRVIDMLPQVEQAFKDQFLKTGLADKKIFLNKYGKSWSGSDYMNVEFKSILRRAGIVQRNLYNTRHTFASQMLAKKIDIGWISKTMGHKNINITLQKYAKYVPKEGDDRDGFLDQFVTLFVTPKEKMA